MRLSLIPLFILAFPIVEIAAFIVVGSEIGVLATLGLILASAVLGVVLVRIQGLGTIERIRAVLDRGGSPGRELVHAVMIVVAGILLIIPGFVSDIVGLLLFLPPVRDVGWRLLRSRLHVTTVSGAGWSSQRRARDGVVDLDAHEYEDLSPNSEPHDRSSSQPRLPQR